MNGRGSLYIHFYRGAFNILYQFLDDKEAFSCNFKVLDKYRNYYTILVYRCQVKE